MDSQSGLSKPGFKTLYQTTYTKSQSIWDKFTSYKMKQTQTIEDNHTLSEAQNVDNNHDLLISIKKGTKECTETSLILSQNISHFKNSHQPIEVFLLT